MRISDYRYHFSLRLLYTGFYRVGTWWNYQNVVSPFFRLFLVTKGQATVYMNKRKYTIEQGDFFLIPAFVSHSYECVNFMEHYYVCFFHESVGYSDLSDYLSPEARILAKEVDYTLVERLVVLNADKKLPAVDPRKYDNNRDIHMKNDESLRFGFATEIESNGILLQLFSRFITDIGYSQPVKTHSHEKFDYIINYIHNNLHQRILVSDLAAIMCNTPDHFSKTFKKIIGISPCEYLQLKRIERAQTYLLTSPLMIKEIAEMVGIPNLSQFSYLFSSSVHCSPRKYRDMYRKEITG